MDPHLIAGNSYGSNVLIDILPVSEKYSRFKKNYVLDIRFDEYLLNLRDIKEILNSEIQEDIQYYYTYNTTIEVNKIILYRSMDFLSLNFFYKLLFLIFKLFFFNFANLIF